MKRYVWAAACVVVGPLAFAPGAVQADSNTARPFSFNCGSGSSQHRQDCGKCNGRYTPDMTKDAFIDAWVVCMKEERTRHDEETQKKLAELQAQDREARAEAQKRQAKREEEGKRAWTARRAAEKAAQEKADAETTAVEAKRQKALDNLKSECGSDYSLPRVGMTLERAEHCIGKPVPVGQFNRGDGIVTTYQSCAPNACFLVYVTSDKVIGWDRE